MIGSSGILTVVRGLRLAENVWFYGFKLPKLSSNRMFTKQTMGW